IHSQVGFLAHESTFSIYVAAHNRIDAHGWRDAENQEVIDQLLTSWHSEKSERLVNQAALYILVNEDGRVELPLDLMRVDPFRTADGYGDVLPRLRFSDDQIDSLLAIVREKVVGDGAQSLVLNILQAWAFEHPRESLDYLDGPREVET